MQSVTKSTTDRVVFTQGLKLMGSQFSLKIVDKSVTSAQFFAAKAIQEIRRLESQLSEFISQSEISQINQHAGKRAVKIAEETYQLLLQCQYLSEVTAGAFDITAASAKSIYTFDRKIHNHPSQSLIEEKQRSINYWNLDLEKTNHAYLRNQGSKISLAAIGKGYAADKAKELLLNEGIESGVVNASGDIAAWGKNLEELPWLVGISDPEDSQAVLFKIPLNNCSLSTSGNQYQFFMSKDTKYSHTLNPQTGQPLSGVKSVSIIHPSAQVSDALATAVSVMGEKSGIRFVNSLKNTSCIIINERNEVISSENIEINN